MGGAAGNSAWRLVRLAAAHVLLNASLTFVSIWPTLAVKPSPRLSFEAAALVGLAAWSIRQVVRRRPHVFAHGVVAYSAVRFLLEFVRDDPERNAFGPLSTSQWIALAIVGAFLAWQQLRSRQAVSARFSPSHR